MSSDYPQSKIVVFDTNKYSGNFERQMCAYVTGKTGDCQVGSEIADAEQANIVHFDWFEDHMAYECDDDNGCSRPVAIWPTPGRFNCGSGIHYDDTPEVRTKLKGNKAKSQAPAYESVAMFFELFPPEEILAEMVVRAQAFCKKEGPLYKGYRLLEPKYALTVIRHVPAS